MIHLTSPVTSDVGPFCWGDTIRCVSKPASAPPEFLYSDLLPPIGADETPPYRLITAEGVSTFEAGGQKFLKVEPEAIRKLTAEAMHDISHYLRPAHLAQLRKIIDDPERRATTASSRSTCSRTSTSPPAACCRCARTPAPRS